VTWAYLAEEMGSILESIRTLKGVEILGKEEPHLHDNL
jgi:hypothetical protein